MTAPSRAISIVYESFGLTSRSRHCRGACPGILVVPSDPLVNDPFSLNSAGGSSQFLTSVIYVHVNAGVAVVSTECSVAHAMSLIFMPYFVAGQLVYMNQPDLCVKLTYWSSQCSRSGCIARPHDDFP